MKMRDPVYAHVCVNSPPIPLKKHPLNTQKQTLNQNRIYCNQRFCQGKGWGMEV